MSQKTIADIYADHITASPHETMVTDRLLLHSGAKSIAEVCGAAIKGYAAELIRLNLQSGMDETLAAKTAEADMEVSAAAMLSAQNDACARCDRILACSPHERIVSSLIIDSATGPHCPMFHNAFEAARSEISRKTLGQFGKS
jgi:hypothetical protein